MPQYSAQKDVVLADLGRREPDRAVAAGNRVGLDAERRDVQRVQHVLGRERDLHRAADRHVQLVDLALAVEVLEPPHPALAGRVDLERLVRRPHELEEDVGAQTKITIEMRNGMIDHASSSGIEPWIGAPTFSGSSVGTSRRSTITTIVTSDGEERRDREDEEVQLVHLGGERGRLFRKERNPRKHRCSGVPFRDVARFAPPHQHNETQR